ncbi:tyrosine-type recombinase/integrase, partial [Palleronia caenipelagi]|uniref:tyrosine-type recombinase/integrase n=1 Tax=Palleronia caenipelagi TaxID=2489174 RepID=UPI00163DDC57
VVLLSDEASQLFKTRRGPRSSDYVFPSQSCPDRPRRSITSAWNHIKRAASLPPSLRLHDLRHTYASHAVLSGESLYLTGKLLGHRNPGSTNRYAHLDSHRLARAADKIADRIDSMMNGEPERSTRQT